jgi:tryptophan synthase alpha subunit
MKLSEEADKLDALCIAKGLGVICFLSPTSTPERIQRVAERARGFIYLVNRLRLALVSATFSKSVA